MATTKRKTAKKSTTTAKKPAERKRKAGNPPGVNHLEQVYKFDSNRKEAYLELLRQGGRRHASARSVGITPQTVINHRAMDAEFNAACDLAEMEGDDEVESALRKSAISGNVTAALAWLYSRRPERWADMRKLEVKHSWQTEIVGLLKEGQITLSDVESSLPAELFREFINDSGLIVVNQPSGSEASRTVVDADQ